MTKPRIIFVILLAVVVGANIPGLSYARNAGSSQMPAGQNHMPSQQSEINQNAQANQPVPTDQNPPVQSNRQTPKPKGGVATVIGVDQPDNCLRIRSGPGSSYDIIGCAEMGQTLNMTGVWTSNDWAQLADNGWVYGPQIQTDLRPPKTAFSESPSYIAVEEEYPVYYDTYPEDYLPDYGYVNYWYGGVPVYLYNVNVWRKFHPWWWHRHRHDGHRVWNRDGGFRQDVRRGTGRNFVTNRPGVNSPTVNRFNTNRLRPGSANAVRPGFSNTPRTRAFSTPGSRSSNAARFRSPNTFRYGSSTLGGSGISNATRSFRTYSGSSALRSGTSGVRQFTRPRSGGFSSGSVGRFSMPRSSGFSGGGRSFSMPRSGGFNIGRSGGAFRSGGGGHRR